jgi:Flp pilus assembly protein TadG
MKRRTVRWMQRFTGDERGSAVFIVGAFLVLLLFVGMATDFGILLRYRRAMQDGCDSAVLAGAQNLKVASPSATAEAQTYAQRDLTQNNIVWNANNFSAQTQDKNGNATGINPVRLWASYQATVPLFFLASASPSVTVSVQCAAQRVPVLTTGLKPLGLDYNVFLNLYGPSGRWGSNVTCTPFGTSGNQPPTGPAYGAACSDCALSTNFSSSGSGSTPQCDPAVGSGNTGALDLHNTQAGCTNNGFDTSAGWGCTFINGTGTNPAYCATPPPTGLSTNSTNWLSCSVVRSKTGLGNGPWRNAASAVCALTDPKQWIVTMPLMNPTIWEGGVNGASTSVDIVAFANFQMDCPYMNSLRGSNPYDPLIGTFVNFVDFQGVVGDPNGVDTGVDTIILVQ